MVEWRNERTDRWRRQRDRIGEAERQRGRGERDLLLRIYCYYPEGEKHSSEQRRCIRGVRLSDARNSSARFPHFLARLSIHIPRI